MLKLLLEFVENCIPTVICDPFMSHFVKSVESYKKADAVLAL